MKSKVPYYSMKLLNLLRRTLLLFIIVLLTATPSVRIISNQFDLKYELCEIYGEEDSKEKEMIVDD
ncbi:hypothetical protein ACFLU5_04325, partial [Bacteroidota bacterium]